MKQQFNDVYKAHKTKIIIYTSFLVVILLSMVFWNSFRSEAEAIDATQAALPYSLYLSSDKADVVNLSQITLESGREINGSLVSTVAADRVRIGVTDLGKIDTPYVAYNKKLEDNDENKKEIESRSYSAGYAFFSATSNNVTNDMQEIENEIKAYQSKPDADAGFINYFRTFGSGSGFESGNIEIWPYDNTETQYLYVCVVENINFKFDRGTLSGPDLADAEAKNRRTNYYIHGIALEAGVAAAEKVEISLRKANGAENATTVDVGDSIELKAQSENALLMYTTEKENRPVITRLDPSAAERVILDAQATTVEGIARLENFTGIGQVPRNYIRINNIWYSYNSGVEITQGNASIPITEDIRREQSISVYALAVEEGKDIPTYTAATYTHALDETVQKPVSTIESGQTVAMGQKIQYTSETGARLFYTTNGSAPSVKLSGTTPVPANATTKLYTDGVEIEDSYASYGKGVTVMVKAVMYDGNGYRMKKDSDVSRFDYTVETLAIVNNVVSNPETTSASPAEVREGQVIRLYYTESVSSNTASLSIPDNVTIYYTVDGTQPIVTKGVMGGSTIQYDSATGIVVPDAGGNTMFTVTAVASIGEAFGNIAHFVFKYPSAISAPYAMPAQGTVTSGTTVTLRSSSADGIIYYEVAYDGQTPQDPTTNSAVFDENSSFAITRKTTIKAFVVRNGISSSVATFTYDVADKLTVPSASITSGSIIPTGSRITLTSSKGATIYYTLDGSNPMAADNAAVNIGSDILIDGAAGETITLRAYASREGYSDSEQAVFTYTISSFEGGIYPDKETGSVLKNGEKVTLYTDVSDATIYYTTDGSIPTTASAAGSTVTISGTAGDKVMLKAIAVAAGSSRTAIAATFSYEIMGKLKAPTSSVPTRAVFTQEGMVELSAEEGTIYYTTDGSDPTSGSKVYTDAIVISKAVTIKAIAIQEGSDASDISEFVYSFADQVAEPQPTIPSGEVEIGTTVQFICDTPDAVLYYTTNGVAPDLTQRDSLNVYTGPITIDSAVTIKMVATKGNMQSSKVVSVGYTVREQIQKETAEVEIAAPELETGNRLQSRNSFSNQDAGPKYDDFILRDTMYGTILSAPEGALPAETTMSVQKVQVSEATSQLIKQLLQESYNVVASYDVRVLVDGIEVEPTQSVEIGLPIPYEYENAIISIVYVADDGTVHSHRTRRSAGMAYADVTHLSVYSIVAPTDFTDEKDTTNTKIILLVGGISLLVILIAFLSRKRKKERRKIKDVES